MVSRRSAVITKRAVKEKDLSRKPPGATSVDSAQASRRIASVGNNTVWWRSGERRSCGGSTAADLVPGEVLHLKCFSPSLFLQKYNTIYTGAPLTLSNASSNSPDFRGAPFSSVCPHRRSEPRFLVRSRILRSLTRAALATLLPWPIPPPAQPRTSLPSVLTLAVLLATLDNSRNDGLRWKGRYRHRCRKRCV